MEPLEKAGRILITDDEETFLHSTAALLQQEGYECTCAIDTTTAREHLNASRYDLLIADIKMPGNPDLEFIRTIPQIAEGLPVILVTGYPSLRSAIDALELPVSAYLLKPLVFDDLLAAVQRAVNRSRAVQAVFTIRKRVADWSRDMENLVPKHTLQDTPQTTVDTTLALSMHNLIRCITDLSTLIQSRPLPDSPQTGRDESAAPRTDRLEGVLLEISASLQRAGVVEPTDGPFPQDVVNTISSLSSREKDVLSKLVTGQRVSTIARSLYISPNTVRNHLKSIFRKVGVHSQAELLEHLRQQGSKG